MSPPADADIRLHPDLESISAAVAESLVQAAAAAITERSWFSLALSGGDTPRGLFRVLRRDHEKRIPWLRVEIFWVDERYVPDQDPRSNYEVARREWMATSPIPRENVHPMPTDLPDPEAAAQQYERVLRAHFLRDRPRFDFMLLGIGRDCHTASLFPGSQALTEETRWVVSVRAPADPPQRLTLTLPVINSARSVHFLVSGAEKSEALKRAVEGEADAMSCPASAVRPTDGKVVWWVDEAAAQGLSTARR